MYNNSFYGGQKGADINIVQVFSNGQEAMADLNRGFASSVHLNDYVLISYGLSSNESTYLDNRSKDTKNYNASIWQKVFIDSNVAGDPDNYLTGTLHKGFVYKFITQFVNEHKNAFIIKDTYTFYEYDKIDVLGQSNDSKIFYGINNTIDAVTPHLGSLNSDEVIPVNHFIAPNIVSNDELITVPYITFELSTENNKLYIYVSEDRSYASLSEAEKNAIEWETFTDGYSINDANSSEKSNDNTLYRFTFQGGFAYTDIEITKNSNAILKFTTAYDSTTKNFALNSLVYFDNNTIDNKSYMQLSYWYFQYGEDGTWNRVLITGDLTSTIANEVYEAGDAQQKVYSASYINNLAAKESYTVAIATNFVASEVIYNIPKSANNASIAIICPDSNISYTGESSTDTSKYNYIFYSDLKAEIIDDGTKIKLKWSPNLHSNITEFKIKLLFI